MRILTLLYALCLACVLATSALAQEQAQEQTQDQAEEPVYRYSFFVHKVYDGDTITGDIDLGFHVLLQGETLRLYGINAPEMRGPEKPHGTITRDWLREQILGKWVHIQTFKDTQGRDDKGKFGRWLAIVWLDGRNLNQEMIQRGLALEAHY